MSEPIIREARVRWALSDASIRLVAARENKVFRVDTPAGSAALRLHRPGYRTWRQIFSELRWMKMLAENGIGVPKPIAAIDGQPIQHIDGIVVSMLGWVDGTPFSQSTPSAALYVELGRTLSTMHTLADAWILPAEFSRPNWNLIGDQPTWGKFWENSALTNKTLSLFLKFRDDARMALEALSPTDVGLIHADLVPDNVLHNGTTLQVIDFDDGGIGYRLFDLATITHRSRRAQTTDVLSNAVINGYTQDRQIDRDALTLFEALRACTYVGWNITRMNEPDGVERNSRFISEAETAIHKYQKRFA